MIVLRQLKVYLSIKLRKVKLSYKPNVVNVEITNACNLNCPGCPRHQMKRKVGFMPRDIFKEIVRQVAQQSSSKFFLLHHFGDPLLYPEALEEFSNYAHEQGLSTGINTKGQLLNDKTIQLLKKSKISQIGFSWIGTTEDEFEKFQEPARYDETMARIKRYLKEKPDSQQAEVGLIISYPPKISRNIIRNFQDEWYRSGADLVSIAIWHNWTGNSERVNKTIEGRKRKRLSCCFEPWSHLTILYNGDVVPCCMDYDGKYILGNITQTSISDIWNGERVVTFREAHLRLERYKFELCKFCEQGNLLNFWDYFRYLNSTLKRYLRARAA